MTTQALSNKYSEQFHTKAKVPRHSFTPHRYDDYHKRTTAVGDTSHWTKAEGASRRLLVCLTILAHETPAELTRKRDYNWGSVLRLSILAVDLAVVKVGTCASVAWVSGVWTQIVSVQWAFATRVGVGGVIWLRISVIMSSVYSILCLYTSPSRTVRKPDCNNICPKSAISLVKE